MGEARGVRTARAASLPWKRAPAARKRTKDRRGGSPRRPRFPVALALGLLAVNAAHAGDTDCGGVPLPPHRFDHTPIIKVTVVQVPFGAVHIACRAHGVVAPRAFLEARPGAMGLLNEVTQEGFETQACSWRNGEEGFVVLPIVGEGDVTPDWQACALRHEIAHLNGWPASHPDSYFGSLYIDVATWAAPPQQAIAPLDVAPAAYEPHDRDRAEPFPFRRIPIALFESTGASPPSSP